MTKPNFKVFADFNNADENGRVRLITNGTKTDLERLGLELEPGLEIILDDNEGLVTMGIVEFSDKEKIWVAKVDWDKLHGQ